MEKSCASHTTLPFVTPDLIRDPLVRRWFEWTPDQVRGDDESKVTLSSRLDPLQASPDLSYSDPMIPPWKAHPNIQAGSIGWRMGDGEMYMVEFNDWFARKHFDAKRRYAEQNPEPADWAGFYRRRDVSFS